MCSVRRGGEVPESALRRVRGDAAAVFVTVAGATMICAPAATVRSGWGPDMGWLLVFVVVGLVAAAVMPSSVANDGHLRDSTPRTTGRRSGRRCRTRRGRAVELHQVGVRNPMADDREGVLGREPACRAGMS